MNIVICEDELLLSFDLKLQLERYGHTVTGEFRRGDELLQWLHDHPADLVIMDIQIAGPINGVETVRRMHAFCDVPVIYVTGSSEVVIRTAVQPDPLALGCLGKPVQMLALRSLLSKVPAAGEKPTS